MAFSDSPAPAVVNGTVIGLSIGKTLGFIGLYALSLLFGVFLIWAYLTNQVLDPSTDPKQVTWWGLLIGIGLVLLMPFLIYLLLRLLWLRTRLIIGSDRLQVVERHAGQDGVVVQIPFENIASFQYEVNDHHPQIGITLRRLDAPGTFTKTLDFKQTEMLIGKHYSISGNYQLSLQDIADRLEEAYAKWSSKQIGGARGLTS